jgi:hypothetical protein
MANIMRQLEGLLICTIIAASSLVPGVVAQAQKILPVTKVFQFPLGGSPESLWFRPNGKLLVNLLAPEASTYQIDVAEGCAKKVNTIPGINALYGIAETSPDQFYVAGGTINLRASTREIGSYAVWHLNMTGFDETDEPIVTKISDFPKATPNGMWTLNAEAGIILVTDSTNGVIYSLDVNTGCNRIVIDDPVLKYPANSSVTLGVNGIETRNGYLYFTNTGAGTFGRIPIDVDGVQTGPGEVLARNAGGIPGGDDWVFDAAGNAYVGENPNYWVSLIRNGSSIPEIIVGGPNTTTLKSPTCARFGVSAADKARGRLYLGNNGGLAQYRSGNFTEGGGIYYIDTVDLAGA